MDSLELELKTLIIDTLCLEDIGPDDIADDLPLFGEGLGLDSIDALELGVALRKHYGLRLQQDDSRNREYFRCIASLADLVRQQRAAPAGSNEESLT